MKKFLNSPETLLAESLAGLAGAHADIMKLGPDGRYVCRRHPVAGKVALIYGALPTGVAAYTLARQLGGDAPLMAAMITVQTLLAFAIMPLWLSLGAYAFGL